MYNRYKSEVLWDEMYALHLFEVLENQSFVFFADVSCGLNTYTSMEDSCKDDAPQRGTS